MVFAGVCVSNDRRKKERRENELGTCWLLELKKRKKRETLFFASVYLTMPWRWISIDFESSFENLEEKRKIDRMYSTDKFSSRSQSAERLENEHSVTTGYDQHEGNAKREENGVFFSVIYRWFTPMQNASSKGAREGERRTERVRRASVTSKKKVIDFCQRKNNIFLLKMMYWTAASAWRVWLSHSSCPCNPCQGIFDLSSCRKSPRSSASVLIGILISRLEHGGREGVAALAPSSYLAPSLSSFLSWSVFFLHSVASIEPLRFAVSTVAANDAPMSNQSNDDREKTVLERISVFDSSMRCSGGAEVQKQNYTLTTAVQKKKLFFIGVRRGKRIVKRLKLKEIFFSSSCGELDSFSNVNSRSS